MSNNICVEYNNKRYIKIDNSFKNREVFNDKLLIVTKGEFFTVKTIVDESGEPMLPYLVSITDKKIKFITDDHTSNHFGLYINENEYNYFFEKKYPYVLVDDVYNKNAIYIQIAFLKDHNILNDFNSGYYFYNFLADSNKFQIISDNDYKVFNHLFKLEYSNKPTFIIPISKCSYVYNYNENKPHYVRLNCLSYSEINYLNNL